MNKYQVALDYIKHDLEYNDFIRYKNGNHVDKYHREILRELVDKATPKKIINRWECPNCGNGYETHNGEYDDNFNYCGNCGQAILWEE